VAAVCHVSKSRERESERESDGVRETAGIEN
jgi:hypothetical protein